MGQSRIKGQALFEVLIGLAVIAILVGGAVTLATVILKSNAQNKFLQSASFLTQDLSDKLSVFAEGSWYCPPGCSKNYGIYNLDYNLPKGSASHYHLSTTTPIGEFTWKSGDETGIMIDGVSYTRYFYVQNICRDSNGDIKGVTAASSCPVGGGSEDPSTQEVTVVVSWSVPGSQPSLTIRKNITRYRNNVFAQTDWIAGPTGPASDPALTAPLNTFFSSSAMSYGSGGTLSLQAGVLNGSLTSNIFDTCPTGLNCGAAINAITWQGSLGISPGSAVSFQLASSDCANGATNYPACNSCGSSNCWDQGSGCVFPGGAYSCFIAKGSTGSFYSDPLNGGHPIKVDPADHKNKRYIRYKAYLSVLNIGDFSPVLNDVIINWSP